MTTDEQAVLDEVKGFQEEEKPQLPSSIPFIVSNEAAERFSFYGMKSILMIYMTTVVGMTAAEGSSWGHWFMGMVYLFPFLGAILADGFFGKYRVIFWLSLVYCCGHLILALPDTLFDGELRTPLFWGLLLIAMGAGGIKSCTSALVGDQFTEKNKSLINTVFGWFYLSINVGSFLSMLTMPLLFQYFGPDVAFGVPGILMGLATVILWSGRKRYVHIPPAGTRVVMEMFSREGLIALGKVTLVFLFLIVFWCVYDQTAFRWVAQAQKMDALIFAGISWLPESIRQFQVLPAHIQVVNPLLVLIFIPLFTYVVYPFVERFYKLTILRKMAWGFVLSVIASIFPYWFELNIQAGVSMNLAWQVVAYVLLTAAEVLVSVTSLEFAYTQAPRSMKTLVMGTYFAVMTCSNFILSYLNHRCDVDGTFLPGADYYRFFLVLSIINVVLFFGMIRFYKERTYLHESKD